MHGPFINPDKCQFSLRAIDFLGHRVTQHDAVPLPDRVEAILQFPWPSTMRGLQEFVGMVTFHHRFVPAVAKIMRPLFQLLTSNRRDVQWNADAVAAFDETKEALARVTMPVHPRVNAPQP
ncbi:uncharacterized protein LOC144607739 [Rhinoraja longicauda]